MKNTKNLGFDIFAILSFFLVKYNIGSVQNLVTTLWVVERSLCSGSSLIDVPKVS